MRKLLFPALLATTALLLACAPSPQPEAPVVAPQAPASAPAPAVAQTAPTATQDEWVLPGWITQATTLEQVQQHFGAANVRVDNQLDGAEGMTYTAWIVFPDDPTKRLELIPYEEARPGGVLTRIRVADPSSRWRDANGLHPGMTLAELVERNGKSIGFSGLDWDYGGTVLDWNGGKFALHEDIVIFPTAILTRRPGLPEGAKVPSGDGEFRSDDKRFPTLGQDLVVGELWLDWMDPDD